MAFPPALNPNPTTTETSYGFSDLSVQAPTQSLYNDAAILKVWEKVKKESLDHRWVYERDWIRNLYYLDGRQWITFHPTRREWIDKRLHKHIPRPVTNKMAETLSTIRTIFAAVNLQAKVRPVSNDTQSIAAAEIGDLMAPLIHDEHRMSQVMREADFWLISTGSACLQISWDTDIRSNQTFIQNEQCALCSMVYPPDQIVAAGNACPHCGATQFTPAMNPDGTPAGTFASFGRGKTVALSPFEYAFPLSTTRWDDLPYIIRLRWREKHWYEANMPELVPKISWEKTSHDRSLQLFKSLAASNDLGVGGTLGTIGGGANVASDGITEYEVWMKPTKEFPQGLLFRVVGDRDPIVLKIPQESLPGPLPYKDIEQKPLFPFVFAQYEHVGGRLHGKSAISCVIQKQDQLNQLDSQTQLITQRTVSPHVLIPEGSGIESISGEPGSIIRWQPLGASQGIKPEYMAGAELPRTIPELRLQILTDIQELTGAYDIIKGQKPTGIEAFSALQLLVERSQSRFTAVFQSRGEMYRDWFAIALELERQFGPDQRVWTVVGPNRGYTFEHFQNAQLQGQVKVQIEDGSTMPRTFLGRRAAVEQANQLMLLNPADPDQRYALLGLFGLTDLSPTLNVHVQKALQIQDEFERWANAPVGVPPLVVKPWFDPNVHWVERVKWLNTDKMTELLELKPELEPIIMEHLLQLQMMLAPVAAPGPGGPPTGPNAPGGGQSMTQSNAQSGAPGSMPSGNNEASTQNQGPM